MPRGAKIGIAERREWLEKYERGATIDTIAKAAGRTQRTVKIHIDLTRHERERDHVRVDLLREAYREHYEDILRMADLLAEKCQSPHPQALSGGEELDDRLLYQGLHSHIHGSGIWKEIKTWEEGAKGLVEESNRLGRQAARLAKEDSASFPEILEEGYAGSLHAGARNHRQHR